MIWRNEPVIKTVNMLARPFGTQVMKSLIIEELGQADILLPSLVTEGLAANDRIKVRMSALQAAAQHAQEPVRPVTDLQVECRAAGIAPAALATLIGGAHLAGKGRIGAPNLASLMKEMVDDAATMIRAVSAGKSAEGETMAARLDAIGRWYFDPHQLPA